MNESKVYPEWVTDRELFEGYMEDIHFFEKPFSWAARPVCEEAPQPTPVASAPEKALSLGFIVGFMWRAFVDDMKWWL